MTGRPSWRLLKRQAFLITSTIYLTIARLAIMPIAGTRSSTLRVERLTTQASWMTATKARSAVLRGSTAPQLRDLQLARAQTRLQLRLPITVAMRRSAVTALATPGAAQAFEIEWHQPIQYRLGELLQKISAAPFCKRSKNAMFPSASCFPLAIDRDSTPQSYRRDAMTAHYRAPSLARKSHNHFLQSMVDVIRCGRSGSPAIE
jgi:hypothetical protein